ncbi:MAG: AAA family ATPase [Oscillospiraceae bacterium]|nr:AAA family ATPase [Oscillospiraceae bacterium]
MQLNLNDYPRIAVIGCPGSGKSTLSRKIAERTGHPLIHLDYENWQPGWVPTPRDEFIAKQHEWVAGERWLIDGNYQGTVEIRYAAADLVIFLDLSRWLCIWRMNKRRRKPRPDVKPGLKDSGFFTKEFAKFSRFVWRYRKASRPKVLALHEQHPHVTFVQLRTRKQVKAFLTPTVNALHCHLPQGGGTDRLR